jgi:hypothetical protein
MTVKIYLTPTARVPGAFDLGVKFDESIGRILEHDPPQPGPFVQFFKARPREGGLRLEGFFVRDGPVDEREILVATLTFHPRGKGFCRVETEILGAYDSEGRDIRREVTVTARPPFLAYE